MKKKIIGLTLFLALLCACHDELDSSVISEKNTLPEISTMIEEADVSDEREGRTNDNPDFNNEYAQAIETYQAFLAGEMSYALEYGGKVTIAPNYGGKYALIDMNGDGIPELITNVIIRQFREDDDTMYASTFSCGIYTYQNGEIVSWYSGGRNSFVILRNKALLYEYEGLGGYNYVYIELDSNGEYSYYMRAFKTQANKNNEWEYYVSCNDDSWEEKEEFATEEEWLDYLEPYLSLQTDMFPWSDYSLGQ